MNFGYIIKIKDTYFIKCSILRLRIECLDNKSAFSLKYLQLQVVIIEQV